MKQQERIIQYLREHGEITSRDAMYELGIVSLQTNLAKLRKKGYVFDKSFETGRNRYGDNVSYCVYRLVE